MTIQLNKLIARIDAQKTQPSKHSGTKKALKKAFAGWLTKENIALAKEQGILKEWEQTLLEARLSGLAITAIGDLLQNKHQLVLGDSYIYSRLEALKKLFNKTFAQEAK